jgi:hypothetical protein
MLTIAEQIPDNYQPSAKKVDIRGITGPSLAIPPTVGQTYFPEPETPSAISGLGHSIVFAIRRLINIRAIDIIVRHTTIIRHGAIVNPAIFIFGNPGLALSEMAEPIPRLSLPKFP